MNEFYLTGIVNKSDLRILESNDLKEFLSDKEGQRFTIELRVQEKDKSKEFMG